MEPQLKPGCDKSYSKPASSADDLKDTAVLVLLLRTEIARKLFLTYDWLSAASDKFVKHIRFFFSSHMKRKYSTKNDMF